MNGELSYVVRFGGIMTLIFTKQLGQYLMDCSAPIDRVQRWKDTNVGGAHKSLVLQCKDDWKEYLRTVQLFESGYEGSRTETGI
jgi:hypothetical protein